MNLERHCPIITNFVSEHEILKGSSLFEVRLYEVVTPNNYMTYSSQHSALSQFVRAERRVVRSRAIHCCEWGLHENIF